QQTRRPFERRAFLHWRGRKSKGKLTTIPSTAVCRMAIYRPTLQSTIEGRPGKSTIAIATGVREITLPARITTRRVAHKRIASILSRACSTTMSSTTIQN
ncbi:hypothetical protein, partial [Actimicrobium sp. CCC2.4]|uniref:hypothetical protein n=1 Tax=Actimicrobium sp. CCC2.4 TaxID=3048606 RepID=UPI002B2456E1